VRGGDGGVRRDVGERGERGDGVRGDRGGGKRGGGNVRDG
jgi:hypothetical protein